MPRRQADRRTSAPPIPSSAAARCTSAPCSTIARCTRHPFYPDAPPLVRAHPDDHRQHARRNAQPHRRRRPVHFQAHLGTASGATAAARCASTSSRNSSSRNIGACIRSYSPSDVFFAATTAARSWRAAIVEAELRAQQGAPAYAYQLDWKSPQDGGKWGAPHTLDIPLVFGTLDKEGSITGTDESAQQMAAQMSDAFIAFARTGNPNTPSIPTWAPYTLARAKRWCSTCPRSSSTIRAAPNAACSRTCRSFSKARRQQGT